jgi:hypothetical protein
MPPADRAVRHFNLTKPLRQTGANIDHGNTALPSNWGRIAPLTSRGTLKRGGKRCAPNVDTGDDNELGSDSG